MGNINCDKYRPSEGRIWSVIFNHPLRLNSSGKKGRWTRRSLKTVDSKTADKLIDEMKDLLSNEELWRGEDGRFKAEKMYSRVITSAFYDSIYPEVNGSDSAPIRENLLPLPSSDDDYNKVLFVGTTGAGKSTLLRQLIGTTSENFPLTTTGKATVSDLEVIVAKGNYKAAVTFFTKGMVEAFVQECVYNALLKAMNEKDKKKIFEELSENKDQTFRLKYIIGNYQDKTFDKKPLSFFGDDEHGSVEECKASSNNEELKPNNVNQYLDRIIQISNEFKKTVQDEEANSTDKNEKSGLDSEDLQKMVYEDKDFNTLVQDIIKDIESHFELINGGFLRLSEKWPLYWEFETDNRIEFLESLRIFSANSYKMFGSLLTPVVQGMRVQGPFSSNILKECPKIVFIDGQGLGHTAESAQAPSIPQKLENMFDIADVVLLVDNAVQPMQHSSLTALKRAVASGYTNKLIIAFTHFDLVEGDNFENINDKKTHVYNSLRNGLSEIEKNIGSFMVERLGSELSSHCLFLENLNNKDSELQDSTKKQLNYLFNFFKEKTKTSCMATSKPHYDEKIFYDEIYSSIEKFRMMWDMRFSGMAARRYESAFDIYGAKKEHWTRIKALNRRIAEFGTTEYDYLRPVSELKSFISEQISCYLDNSLKWGIKEPAEEEKLKFTDAIRRSISRTLNDDIQRKMIDEHMSYWIQANNYSGMGSTKLRSRDIDLIYDQVSPLMKTSANWREIATYIKSIVDDSIDSVYKSIMEQSLKEPDEPSNFIHEGIILNPSLICD